MTTITHNEIYTAYQQKCRAAAMSRPGTQTPIEVAAPLLADLRRSLIAGRLVGALADKTAPRSAAARGEGRATVTAKAAGAGLAPAGAAPSAAPARAAPISEFERGRAMFSRVCSRHDIMTTDAGAAPDFLIVGEPEARAEIERGRAMFSKAFGKT